MRTMEIKQMNGEFIGNDDKYYKSRQVALVGGFGTALSTPMINQLQTTWAYQ